MSRKLIQTKPTTLSYGISSSATAMRLDALYKLDGTSISASDIGDLLYGTFDPGTSREEIFSIVGANVTVNSDGTLDITGVVRGLKEVDPYGTGGFSIDHPAGAVVVFGDNPQVYNALAFKANDEHITGQWTFDSFPITPATPNASASVIGMSKLSVAPVSPTIPIAVGDNDPRMIPAAIFAGLTGIVSPYAGSSAPTGWLICDGSAVSRATYAALFALISTTYGAGDGSTTFNVPDLRNRTPIGVGTGTKVATFASRASNVITVTGLTSAANNEFQTGQAVVYHYATSAITGLVQDTTYYLIRISNTTFSLATSLANAIAGTAIALSSDGSGAQTFTLTFTARTLAATGGEENHGLVIDEIPAHTHTGPTVVGAISGGASSGPNNGSTASGSTGGSNIHNNMQPFIGLNYIIKT